MQVTNSILEAYPYCHYKVYLKLHGKIGKRSDYNEIQNELLCRYYPSAIKRLIKKTNSKRVLHKPGNSIDDLNKRYEIILNFTLSYDNYEIPYDGLKLQRNDNLRNNKFIYSPVIVSPKEKVRVEEKIFMVMKGILLGNFQGKMPDKCFIIYGKTKKSLSVKVNTYIQKGQKCIDEIDMLIKKNIEPKLLLNKHCSICEFYFHCTEQAKNINDLSLLRTLSEKEILKLNNRGIYSLEQYSYTFSPRKIRNKTIYRKKIRHHSLQALAIREDKVFIFDQIDFKLKPIQIYLDVEGLPDENYVYLIGIVVVDDNNDVHSPNANLKKVSFWAGSPDEEKTIFENFILMLSQYDNYQLFHYGSYETRLFKRMKKVFTQHGKIIDKIISNSVNITTLIYEYIYFPTYSNQLKEIGRYLGCRWSLDEASGIQSIYWRKKWEITENIKWKKILVNYNHEDCLNLAIVVHKIKQLMDSAVDKDNANVVCAKSLERWSIYQKYCPKDFNSDDYNFINKASYFDYQREKVFIRTNPSLKKYSKTKKKKHYLRTNKYISLRVRKCPFCKNFGLKIQPGERRYKYALDLKFTGSGVKKWKISYYSDKYLCPKCGKSFYAPKLKKAKYRYLYNVKVWVVYHYVVSKLSFDRIAQYSNDLFGFNFKFKRVILMKNEMAQYYKTTHKKILNSICSGNTIHVDETPIQLRDRRAYVWVLTSLEAVYYIYQESREVDFLKALLKNYSGVVVSDFYPGYDAIDCRQQKCLVHLIRDLNDDLYKHPYDSELKYLINAFSILLKGIVETIDKYGLKQKYLRKHKKDVEEFFTFLLHLDLNSEMANKYKHRFKKNKENLFTFLDWDGVPWNNNNAERAIKAFAKWRAQVKGQIWKIGVEDFCILLSVYQTCNYKGINFLDFLLSKKRDIDKFHPDS